MELLNLSDWRLEYDRPATVGAYTRAMLDDFEPCDCNPCRNWVATRDRLLPDELRKLLDLLGIPPDQEAEIFHNCRLESGLHSYGGSYHFVGNILFGERESSAPVDLGGFQVYFHTNLGLLPTAFAGLPVVQLEVMADVPWLSDIPEAD